MSKRHKRKSKRETPKWYYDACALDIERSYTDITDTTHNKVCMVSHLALGEAYGNCLAKGQNAVNDLIQLILKLQKNKFLKVVGNDCIDDVFNDIRTTFCRLSITDSMHLATAIKNKCSIFKTTDGDFNIERKRVQTLAANHGIKNFSIDQL